MRRPGTSASWDSTAWQIYYTRMHEYERVDHTTSGPGGQAVVEDTQIDIAHVPER